MSDPAPTFGGPILATERAGNLIAHEIRLAILEGRLEPGDVLREEQLARELGTSRTPVREALIELRNEGLVESQATRRAVVRAYNAAELHDIYTLRAALEAHAARLAAERGTEETSRELAASNDRFHELAERAAADELAELVSENLVFHGVIAEATGVPRLQKMIDQVMVIPKRYRAYAAYVPEHRRTVEEDHRRIAEAIGRRDAEAAGRLMDAHVRWTGEIAVAAQKP
jgi:DNA-binding GntR family transcriptional regulator